MQGFQADPRTSAKGFVLVDPENQRSFGTDNPLPIASGPRSALTATIANGASLSGSIAMGNGTAGRVGMPAVVTGTGTIVLTFQTSHDNVTFKDMCDQYGNEYAIGSAGKIAQGKSYLLPLADFASIAFLKIRTGTSAAPQAQGQSTDITVTAVA